MTSPLLALFVRSLREDSRLKFTYFSRAGLVAVILFFLFMVQSSFGWSNAPGLHFFETVIGVDLAFVILAGVSYFSSAISEEKEEMTLGLLRMTNLNPLSILLGKSTSRLCNAVLLFAAQLPFTLLAVTLGGISLRQIFAAYFTIAAFLALVSNLALLASVVSRRSSGAAVLTGVALLFFFAVVPIAAWFAQLPMRLGIIVNGNAVTQALDALSELALSASPFTRMGRILTPTGFSGDVLDFQIWSNLALAAVCFLFSWVIFEKFCSEQKETAPTRVGVARTSDRRRSVFSAGRSWMRALAWKDFYFTTGGKLWLFIKLLIYGTPLLVIRCWPKQLGGPPTWEDFGIGTFWIMIGFIFVELAFAAGSVFRNEHQGQTLSSLAMLPQGIRSVAYQKLLGIAPALFAAGAYLLLSVPLVAKPFAKVLAEISHEDEFVLVLISFVSQGIFFLHLVTVLSLYVKRGALPLAVGIHFLLFVFMGLTEAVIFRDEAGWFLLSFFTLGAALFLHVHIGNRLETLAAEE